jgi:branched-chain amino acid aminotransferase
MFYLSVAWFGFCAFVFYFYFQIIQVSYINYNGKIFSATENIITAQNRGLRYGDGIFETIKLKNAVLILSDEHFARLWRGMQLLKFEIPKLFSLEKFEAEILVLAAKNKLTAARVRLTIVRGDGGIYDAKNHTPNYIIEAIALPEDNGPLNSNGLQLCFYDAAKKTIDTFSNCKTNNYLPYFMGALYAKENQCNDAIILNSDGNVCDSTIANVFYIKDNVIHTPALTQGCVAGVMRKFLIDKIRTLGFTVHESIVTKNDLLEADEIFLSNAIYNIRWVGGLENKNYANKIVWNIVEELLRKEPSLYC